MLWRPGEHEPLTERPWQEALAQEAIGEIVADAEGAHGLGFWPGHPLDEVAEGARFSSLYLGSAGMAWGLRKLGSSLDAAAVLSTALEHYRRQPDDGPQAHPPSLLAGESGILAVAGAIGAPAADRSRLRELVERNREHPTWELLWGSAGTMIAARAAGLEPEWRQSAALLWARWDEGTDLWTQVIHGHGTRYLGPAHGLAGNVHALRGYVSDEQLRARVTRVLERCAGDEDGLVNWPPVDAPWSSVEDRIRVQWCHGAPGILSTVGDLVPPELALAAGELTWRAGPLRKGGGLCHGTAGNGFAFLRLYSLTGDALWLERAQRFAVHAVEQVQRHRAAYGRGRYTLFTGDIGVALYLEACLRAEPRFPILDGL